MSDKNYFVKILVGGTEEEIVLAVERALEKLKENKARLEVANFYANKPSELDIVVKEKHPRGLDRVVSYGNYGDGFGLKYEGELVGDLTPLENEDEVLNLVTALQQYLNDFPFSYGVKVECSDGWLTLSVSAGKW